MDLNLFQDRHDRQAAENEQSEFRTFSKCKNLDAQVKELLMTSRFRTKQLKDQISASVFLIVLVCIFALPSQAYAKDVPNSLPSLNTFIETVKDGDAALHGVYVSNVMAFAVVQQPVGYPGYVSTADSVVTQFSIATEVGNVGLLAHNTHAGSLFTKIKQGDRIILVYGNGHTETFIAQSIQRYQAFDPLNPHSQFKDLEMRTSLTAEELFNKVYRGEYHLTLQTCIEKDGNTSWGRLFILASPVENEIVTTLESTEMQYHR